ALAAGRAAHPSRTQARFRSGRHPESGPRVPGVLMQTRLADFMRGTPEGAEAAAILNKCVHCGFCTAVCPTYQVLGDDLDSPRGRTYLMRRALKGGAVTDGTRLHRDRCLTCRACETACPSGVEYGRLVDIGRAVVENRTSRSPLDRIRRVLLARVLTQPVLF